MIMEAWGTHFVTFLVGVATGACGGYFGNKFTDKRRYQEKKNKEIQAIRKIYSLMPELIDEMKEDFKSPKDTATREFVVMPSRDDRFNSGGIQRFYYFETEHENLKGKIAILENHGYLIDVTPGNVPIYRINEKFWELVRKL